MIYPSGKIRQEGFTLLEVLIAVTIFAVSFTLLVRIQSESISKVEQNFKRLEAVKFFKEKIYSIPERETSDEIFNLREEKKKIEFGIDEIIYTVVERKTGKKILEIKTYER